jgi:hypothetical protein
VLGRFFMRGFKSERDWVETQFRYASRGTRNRPRCGRAARRATSWALRGPRERKARARGTPLKDDAAIAALPAEVAWEQSLPAHGRGWFAPTSRGGHPAGRSR